MTALMLDMSLYGSPPDPDDDGAVARAILSLALGIMLGAFCAYFTR